MNVFILTDVEGIIGVTSVSQMDQSASPELRRQSRSTEIWAGTRRALTNQINLAGRVCRECGAEKIWYLDGHGGGGTVLEDEVDPFLTKVSITEWQDLLCAGVIDCQIEIGSHARAGTVGGFLDHTLSSTAFFTYRVNGKEMSELGLHAALCGAHDVPIVFCSGDAAACKQAKEYVPEIVTAAVKEGTTRNECTAYPDAEARLEAGIREALAKWKSIPPVKIPLPAVVELTYYRTDMCENALANSGPEVERIDARTLRKTSAAIVRYSDLRI